MSDSVTTDSNESKFFNQCSRRFDNRIKQIDRVIEPWFNFIFHPIKIAIQFIVESRLMQWIGDNFQRWIINSFDWWKFCQEWTLSVGTWVHFFFFKLLVNYYSYLWKHIRVYIASLMITVLPLISLIATKEYMYGNDKVSFLDPPIEMLSGLIAFLVLISIWPAALIYVFFHRRMEIFEICNKFIKQTVDLIIILIKAIFNDIVYQIFADAWSMAVWIMDKIIFPLYKIILVFFAGVANIINYAIGAIMVAISIAVSKIWSIFTAAFSAVGNFLIGNRK